MSKNLIYRLLIGCAFLVAAVLYLLSVVAKDTFGFFNLNWAVVIFAGISGIAFLLKGIFEKNVGIMKKLNISIGCGLAIIAVVAVIFALKLGNNLIFPIIAVIVSIGIVLSILVVGGKKWDAGDNNKVGYKNYYERKKEEEKQNAKTDKED